MPRRKKTKEYKVPSKRQPFFACIKWIFVLTCRAKVIDHGEPLPECAIYIGNHSAKKGVMAYEVSLPVFNIKWGAHEMFENFRARYHYLRDVLYMQKLKKGKVISTIKAFVEAIFSPMLYRGMKFVPTYPDVRFSKTLRYSMQVLDSGASMLIFPEDSSDGYFDELTHAFPGYVMLAERYKKSHGKDIPIIPLYYDRSGAKIHVGKAHYVTELIDSGMSREDIAEFGKNEINGLYHRFVKTDADSSASKV